ncbi:MAG TPA: 1,4-dihydroxy-2-naphthoate polyprenyltransferase [Clostridiaceae bacterium]|nr:1,4-dihydroxy-2-naphthoate polyprenyltransferase [Clostridiaceae bacterium]
MSIKSFLKLVEIQTKIASVTPFAFGVVYTLFRYGTFNVLSVLFFFISMLCFDMFTTALNNYKDYKRAIKREGYNYELHNAISKYKLRESTVIITIITLFTLATAFGVLTFIRSDIWMLMLGMMCFGIGIIYSAGPLPVSRTPLGEIFSGGTMGLMIPFLVVYASIYGQKPISLALEGEIINLSLNWALILPILLSSLPAVFCIANIMLANNICDIEDDFTNKRYTLPILIGRRKALYLFAAIYILSYLDIILCVILGYLPPVSLLTLLAAYKVYKNVKAFFELQTKKDTFALSVMNLVLIMFPLIVTVLLAVIF